MKPIATIYADENGEASIRWRRHFEIEEPIYRADVLQDVLVEVQHQYNGAVDLMINKFEAAKKAKGETP